MWYLKNIPRKAHFYWGNKILPFDRFLSVASFAAVNRDWDDCLHTSTAKSDSLDVSWDSLEHKNRSDNKKNSCYWGRAEAVCNIRIVEHDLSSLGDISEVHKSDFLRWELLAEEGGLWSDIDILYFRPMEKLYFNIEKKSTLDIDGFKVDVDPEIVSDVVCVCNLPGTAAVNSIGFLMSEPGSKLFRDVCLLRDFFLEKRRIPNLKREYQSLGRQVLDNMVFEHEFLVGKPSYKRIDLRDESSAAFTKDLAITSAEPNEVPLPGGINLPQNIVYPYVDPTIHLILQENHLTNDYIEERTIGIHWYGGHPRMGKFMGQLDENSIWNLAPSIMKDFLVSVVKKHWDYLFPA